MLDGLVYFGYDKEDGIPVYMKRSSQRGLVVVLKSETNFHHFATTLAYLNPSIKFNTVMSPFFTEPLDGDVIILADTLRGEHLNEKAEPANSEFKRVADLIKDTVFQNRGDVLVVAVRRSYDDPVLRDMPCSFVYIVQQEEHPHLTFAYHDLNTGERRIFVMDK